MAMKLLESMFPEVPTVLGLIECTRLQSQCAKIFKYRDAAGLHALTPRQQTNGFEGFESIIALGRRLDDAIKAAYALKEQAEAAALPRLAAAGAVYLVSVLWSMSPFAARYPALQVGWLGSMLALALTLHAARAAIVACGNTVTGLRLVGLRSELSKAQLDLQDTQLCDLLHSTVALAAAVATVDTAALRAHSVDRVCGRSVDARELT